MNCRLVSALQKILNATAGSLLVLIICVVTTAQTPPPTLTLTASFAGKESVAPTELIEFKLSRALQTSEKIAVLIGQTDATNLFTINNDSLSFLPAPFALPNGKTEITVYLIATNDEWQELARFPIQVTSLTKASAPTTTTTTTNNSAASQPTQEKRRRFGMERLSFTPTFTLGFKSQFGGSFFPVTNKPERPKFFDTTLQGSLKGEMSRGTMNANLQFDLVGSSFRKEALRFNEIGDRANNIDLANYLMQFNFGRSQLVSGHTTYGTNRHLINSFASRGLTFTAPVGKRDDFSVAALNGTSVVGFDNFFGLNNSSHQIATFTWGHEFLKERPSGLRTEFSFLDGSLLPRTGVNQGSITDAEKSQGYGFRFIASDQKQRAKLDGGFTRSRFTNPPDPLLNRGQNIVQVQEVNRNARYVDVNYDILKDLAITKTKKFTLNTAFHHEQADPLFRSVAATAVQADRRNNQWDVTGNLDQLNFTLTHQRFNDNLANIASILKSLTRRNAFAVNAPLSAFIGKAGGTLSLWLPRVGFNFDRIHQFAAALPVNGGFEADLSTVPNQLSLNQTLTAEWQVKKVRFGYRWNRSSQDNRQTGREIADLYNNINGVTFGFTPNQKIDLNFDVNSERARNVENKRTDQTWRFGFNTNLQLTKSMTLTAALSTLNAFDLGQISDNFTNEFNAQWAYRFLTEKSKYRKVNAQFFVRYANFFAHALDRTFATNNLTKSWTMNAGLNFTFF